MYSKISSFICSLESNLFQKITSVFKDLKKISATALSQQFPLRLILQLFFYMDQEHLQTFCWHIGHFYHNEKSNLLNISFFNCHFPCSKRCLLRLFAIARVIRIHSIAQTTTYNFSVV